MKNNKTYQTVILNLIQDLQRLPFQCKSNSNNLRGRFQIKFGMTSLYNNRGFTLIELLVVVLIIGILATVAVPQYQKAVWKSRASELEQQVRALATAQEVYLLANGEYPSSFAELDIDSSLPAANSAHSKCDFTVTDGRGNGQYELFINNKSSDSPHYNSTVAFVKGPYTCAGFSISHLATSNHQLECIEVANAVSPAGIFCEKVMHGTFIGKKSGVRRYSLP